MFRILLMVKNMILSAGLLLSAVLALSVLAKADFGAPAFAQEMTSKMHLEERIKALKAGNNQGALMHLAAADQLWVAVGINTTTKQLYFV
jgi:hypothetical protein